MYFIAASFQARISHVHLVYLLSTKITQTKTEINKLNKMKADDIKMKCTKITKTEIKKLCKLYRHKKLNY